VLENVDVVRDFGVHVDCLLKFDRHISLIVHKAMTRARLILRCFLSRDRQKLIVFMSNPYLNIAQLFVPLISNFWYLRWKVFNVSLQNACRACGGMEGYDDRLMRLLNTHLEYSDPVLCFQLLSNSFNSQLANVLITSADNRTRGHDFKLIKTNLLFSMWFLPRDAL